MPELPEVETVCNGLRSQIIGTIIEQATVNRRDLRQPIPSDFEKRVGEQKITAIRRRAKYVLIELANGDVVIVHLGMSGSLILYDKSAYVPRKHDHVLLEINDGRILALYDPRRFGLMTVAGAEELDNLKIFADLGGEPLDDKIDADYLLKVLKNAKTAIKIAIMDQVKLVGVGNIYAAESLFRSRINPEKPANTLTKSEARLLIKNIKQILLEAIELGGSTLRDYVRSSGDKGDFQNNFNVYGREGLPCKICDTPIASIRQGGRSTFFCPKCQA